MTEIQPNFIRGKRGLATTVVKQNQKNNINRQSSYKHMRKPSMEDRDMPDVLYENNSKPSKQEKLLNPRKARKHMTQISHQDKPDVLFGINEYKEVRAPKRFHSIRKLSSTSQVQDVPDTLEPILDESFKGMPKPDSMTNIKKSKIEESKNSENINKSIEKQLAPPSIDLKSGLEEIKEEDVEAEEKESLADDVDEDKIYKD